MVRKRAFTLLTDPVVKFTDNTRKVKKGVLKKYGKGNFFEWDEPVATNIVSSFCKGRKKEISNKIKREKDPSVNLLRCGCCYFYVKGRRMKKI